MVTVVENQINVEEDKDIIKAIIEEASFQLDNKDDTNNVEENNNDEMKIEETERIIKYESSAREMIRDLQVYAKSLNIPKKEILCLDHFHIILDGQKWRSQTRHISPQSSTLYSASYTII